MQALLTAATGLTAIPLLPEHAWALPASKGQTPDVSTYLPPAGVDDFVEFVVTKDKTPVCIFLHPLQRGCFTDLGDRESS